MALLFMDSFDHYATADITEKWTSLVQVSSGTGVINTTGGRRSSGSFRVSPNFSSNPAFAVAKALAPADATCVSGFAVLIPAGLIGTTGLQIGSVREGVTAQVTLRVNSTFTLSVLRGTQAGTVLGTSSVALAASTYAYIEWKVLIHPSAGTVDVRVNGASVLSLTAQNTRNTATAAWTDYVLGQYDQPGATTNGVASTIDFDDFYVLDGSGSAPWNTFLGDCRVDARYPTAEGFSSAWTPLSGTDNALMVDDPGPPFTSFGVTPDDDTTYNSTATVGATDTHVTQDAPVVGAAIFGIQHCLNMKKSDAGACTVSPVIRHSSVDYPGAALSPGTSYAYGLQIAQTNPGTSAQWTEAGFNAAEFGYKRVS